MDEAAGETLYYNQTHCLSLRRNYDHVQGESGHKYLDVIEVCEVLLDVRKQKVK